MRLVALIPARYGSTRSPGKPLAPILGKPLIQWVYEQALKVGHLSGVWVATDDERILKCVQVFGGQALMTRSDYPSGSDRLAEAASLLKLEERDIVVNIQGDQPVFPPKLIGQLAGTLLQNPDAVMVSPARRIDDPAIAQNPNVVKVVFDRQGRALYFSRSPLPYWRDGQAPYFYKHIGIYGYRVDFLQRFVGLPPGRLEEAEKLEQVRALEHGFAIQIVETAGDTVEVDTPEDLKAAEKYFKD